MKRIHNKTLIAIAAATVLLLAGCTKDPHNEGFGQDSYLSLNIDGQQTPSTAESAARQGASTRAVNESAVKDLWVLQFQMTAGSTTAGTLVAKAYISSATDLADLTKIKFTYKPGINMALYLVANTGSSSLFNSTVLGTTLAAVKATAVTVYTTKGNGFPTDASTSLPMVGQSDNLTFPTTTAVKVKLTRTVAKVVLTVKNGLTTGYPRLTVSSTQLKNVPKNYSMQVVKWSNLGYYPIVATNNFTNYTAVTGDITATGTTWTYYLAPNMRGLSTNTDERLKSDATAPAGQGAYCTYVEILGTAKATADSPEVDVRYRLYLGKNNTDDFNLLPNTVYKVGIQLTGLFSADARLTITTDKFDLVLGGIEGSHDNNAGNGWIPPIPAVGDFYFTDGTTGPKLVSGKTVCGIVYSFNPVDPLDFKIFSLSNSLTMSWARHYSVTLGPAGQSDTDGEGNVAAMQNFAASNNVSFSIYFPAASYCEKLNPGGVTGWYLPAKDELAALYDAYSANKAVLDAALSDAAGSIFSIKKYWSSTENSDNTNGVWYTDFGGVRTGTLIKDERNVNTRCVRKN